MSNSTKTKNNEHKRKESGLLDIIKLLHKWFKHILIATAIIAFVSIVVSLLIPVYYKSTTIFYAASPDLADPSPVGASDEKKLIYGSDLDLDRLFSIANSNEIANHLISKFNLYEHYDIDTSNSKSGYFIREQLNDQFSTLKTKYDALQLSVEDEDKELAAEMANDARNQIAIIAQNIIKQSQIKTINNLKENVSQKDKRIGALNDTLASFRKKYSIYDTKTQGEIFAEISAKNNFKLVEKKSKLEYYKKINRRDSIRSLSASIAALTEQNSQIAIELEKFNAGISIIKQLELEQLRLSDQISLDKERYNQLKAAYDAPFTALHIIEEAEVPIVKSRPKRSIIVLGATFLGFVLSILAVLLMHSYRNLNWKEIFDSE